MLVAMVLLSGSALKHGTRFFTGGSGLAGSPVSSEESDLMSTVLQSAFRLLSGKANRSELAGELSDKLYDQRGNAGDMSELGIELVKAKKSASAPGAGADHAEPQADAKSPEKPGAPTAGPRTATLAGKAGARRADEARPGPELISGKSQGALSEIWRRMKPYSVELGLVPVVFLGMVLVSRVRRRKQDPAFVPAFGAVLAESDCETYEMKHPMQSLGGEEFELVVAAIYQRQGYRVSLPAGLGGGRSGDFKLSRKSERLLVQCQQQTADHRVPAERVRELHDAMTDAGATGGLYVASCGFSWDARHFAKTRSIKLISARTLDALLNEARATPDENFLAVTPWVSKFMTKVELTTPRCPACEAEMELEKAGDGSEWLCSQRPECRGQRSERKYRKGQRTPGQDAVVNAGKAEVPKPAPESVAPVRREPGIPVTPPAKPMPTPIPAGVEGTGRGASAAGTPPVIPVRQAFHMPEPRPITPTPAPIPARVEVTGKSASPASTPPVAASRPDIHVPVPPPVIPKPAPTPVRIVSKGTGAKGGGTQPVGPRRQGFQLPEARPATPKPAPNPARGEGTGRRVNAGSVPAPAPRRQGFHLPEARPAAPKPAPSPLRGEGTGRSSNAGSAPASAPRRQGFHLPEIQPATPKPAPNPARSGGTGSSADAGSASPPAARRRGFDLPETQPAMPKPAPSPAWSNGTGSGATAGGNPTPAARRRGFSLEETRPTTPRLAPDPGVRSRERVP